MKKYFICSDIHSFYTELKEALESVNFDINNEEHILVINGDLFDRGDETNELYNFIMSIPKNRRILIKGNHEQLYLKLLEKELGPDYHDFTNGTVKTFCNIAKVKEISRIKLISREINIKEVWPKILEKVKDNEITKFIKSDEFINYYELGKYIITHSFIPLQIKDIPETAKIKHYPISYVEPQHLEIIPNWRISAKNTDWEEATWGCPYEYFNNKLFNEEITNGKILVCGH